MYRTECKVHWLVPLADLQVLILISQVIDPVGQHRDFLLVQLTRKLGYPRIGRRHVTQAGHGHPVASLPRVAPLQAVISNVFYAAASSEQAARPAPSAKNISLSETVEK